MTTENGWSILHAACFNNHLDVVRQFLRCTSIDIDTCKNEGSTSLCMACRQGHIESIRELIKYNSDINQREEDGWSPLQIACYYNHEDIVLELLKYSDIDINPGNIDGCTSLFIACYNGNDEIVKELTKHIADMNKCTKNGWSPFDIACKNNHVKN